MTTDLVDLTKISLTELCRSDDPVLLRSLELVACRTERGWAGVLQNQAPNGR